MELRALWKVFLRRWWLVAIPAAVALALAAYGYLTAPPGGGFSASVRFTAATPPGAETVSYEDDQYYPWLASEYVVNALTDWVRTGSFAGEVSARLAAQGVQVDAGAVQGSIVADNARSVMLLTVSGSSAETVVQIAQAAADVLSERAGAYFPQFGGDDLQVIMLDAPVAVPVPPPLSARFEPLVRFGLGLAAGVALAFLVEYLDPTLREREQVEALGLTVLAEVPRERR